MLMIHRSAQIKSISSQIKFSAITTKTATVTIRLTTAEWEVKTLKNSQDSTLLMWTNSFEVLLKSSKDKFSLQAQT